MGIKGLWKYLTQNYPTVYENVPITEFTGRRIVLDAGAWMYPKRMGCKMKVAMKTNVVSDQIDDDEVDRLWLQRIIVDIMMFMKYGITIVIAFDGKPPDAKRVAHEKRNKAEKQRNDKILVLREKLRQADRFARLESDIFDLKKLMGSVGGIPKESYDKLRSLLNNLGIKCYIGVDNIEAERLGAGLVRIGVCSAIYSSDGDSLTHLNGVGAVIRDLGENRVLSTSKDKDGFDIYHTVPTFNIVRTQSVLQHMKLSAEQFTELCIMSGCDYNNNIPRLTINQLAEKFQTLQRIEQVVLTDKQRINFYMLNHEESRQLFKPIPVTEMLDTESIAASFQTTVSQLTEQILYDIHIHDQISLSYYMIDKQLHNHTEKYLELYNVLPSPLSGCVMGLLPNTQPTEIVSKKKK